MMPHAPAASRVVDTWRYGEAECRRDSAHRGARHGPRSSLRSGRCRIPRA